MAGDWIKLELSTLDKPEVVKMAARLAIDQDAVTGKLLRVWAWADQNTLDGNAVSVTSAFLDRLTVCPGFANAMREAGWLIGDDLNLSFPNFDRHNGITGKKRSETNRRVKNHRERNADSNENVTQEPLQKALPEKRREEKEEYIPARDEAETDDMPGSEPLIGKYVALAARYSIPEWYARVKWEAFSAKGWHSGKTPLLWKKTMTMIKSNFVNDGSPMKPGGLIGGNGKIEPIRTASMPSLKDHE
jgi:hypothetical protein